jgi:dihydropteroate synthase
MRAMTDAAQTLPQAAPSWPAPIWRLSPRVGLTLNRPRLMAILNVTPDSFSDGGLHHDPRDPQQALDAARRLVAEGADILDIGGESTRPGAVSVPWREQCERVVPVIQAIRADADPRVRGVPITVDTTSVLVAQRALECGADAVNDVSAGTADVEMLGFCAARGSGIVLMHRAATPEKDRYSDRYGPGAAPLGEDAAAVVGAVRGFLHERALAAIGAGVAREAIVLDPGLGFGKTVEQNLALIEATPRLMELGFPILSGLSRKSFVGRAALGRDSDPSERVEATLRFSMRHAALGARILRVHDVAAHALALRDWLPTNPR